MSNQLIQQRLIIQNENSNIIPKKTMMISEEKKKSKLGLGKGSRKALNDITNKPKIHQHQETSTKKKNSQKEKEKEEFNIAEERFLHDHNKCIQAQQTITESMFWDIVLPGHYGNLPLEAQLSDPLKIDHYTPVELEMSEFCDWLELGPPSESPLHLESTPCSPRAWDFEEVEFFLKPEIDI
ncbi:protein PATRONUS 1 [Lactuca sativa]|nr:protein PATRONUS 1 [Lactuca sativa]